MPELAAEHGLVEEDVFDFSSGYIQRALHLMPKSATDWPWRLSQDYQLDRRRMEREPVEDGIPRLPQGWHRASGPGAGTGGRKIGDRLAQAAALP